MSHPGNTALLERLYEEAIELGLDEEAAVLYAERKMAEMEFLTEAQNKDSGVILIDLDLKYKSQHSSWLVVE